MANAEMAEDTPPKKKSKLPLLIGLILALVSGGGGFYAMYSGMLGVGATGGQAAASGHTKSRDIARDIAFVPVDPLIISLGPGAANRYLKLTTQLEVSTNGEAQVTELMPRVLDVLNGYLRAVSISDLEDRSALIRLRAQMLRRVQVVTGEGNVRDLLITEFVLN